MTSVLSYKDWLKSEKGNVTLPDPYASYLDYVSAWYESSFGGRSTAELTADEYRNFILTLKNVSTDPDVIFYINNLDLDNVNELQTAIPYFAKNLTSIASTICENRIDAKHSTRIDSYLNSNKGIELEIYKNLLGFYASTSNLSGDLFLDAVKFSEIEIEELYDDDEYLDKEPSLNASDYFSTSDTSSFLSADDDYIQWVVEAGFNDLYSDNDTFNPETSAILSLSGYINYELSGTSVDYYKGNLAKAYMGEAHYSLSGTGSNRTVVEYSSTTSPWNNLSNRYFPTIANVPLLDGVYPVQNIGGFFIPSKLGMSVALGLNKFVNLADISLSGIKLDHFPDGSVYSNGYTFTKTYQDSYRPYNTYLNWIEIKQVRGDSRGIIASDGQYQEMIPYQTRYESSKIANLGINRVGDKLDPWYLSEDKVWRDEDEFPPDFRNIYNVGEWYSTTNGRITGYQDQWAIDIYGNNYAIYKNLETDNLYARRNNSTGKLFIRSEDGTIDLFQNYFNDSYCECATSTSGFGFNSLRYFHIYDDLIIMEDGNDQLIIQRVELSGSSYILDTISIISTLNFEPTGGSYKTLGHYYDDRDQILYFGRYNINILGYLEFIIYKYQDGKVISMYDTSEDDSEESIAMKANFGFTNISQFPCMTISTIHDKLYVSYIAHVEGSARYIVIIPIIMGGTFTLDEITVVRPQPPSSPIYSLRGTESIRLINTMISEDNVILLLEGQFSNSKYLQCIPLN